MQLPQCMRYAIGVTLLVALFACGGGSESAPPPKVSTTRTTSAALTAAAIPVPAALAPPRITTTANAVARITAARCDHEAACDAAAGKHAVDRDACMNEHGHDVVAAVTDDSCPAGIGTDSLDTCIGQMQALPCGSEAVLCTRDFLCGR